jgi:hypothetical protein
LAAAKCKGSKKSLFLLLLLCEITKHVLMLA